MSVFDMLGIDENAGIDTTEIEAIKATLERIKVVAAGVAKDNDTTDSLAILKEIERTVRKVASSGVHSVDELHQQLGTYGTAGGGANTAAPRALGAGAAPSQERLLELMTELEVYVGPDASTALKRMALPAGHPDRIEVNSNGEDVRVAGSKAEIAKVTADRDKARKELDDLKANPAQPSDAELKKAREDGAREEHKDRISDLKELQKDVQKMHAKGGFFDNDVEIKGKAECLAKIEHGIKQLEASS